MSDQRRDAMRALGVTLIDCVVCGKAFNVNRYPRYWCSLLDYRRFPSPGEVYPEDVVLCSEACAEECEKARCADAPGEDKATWYVFEEPWSGE